MRTDGWTDRHGEANRNIFTTFVAKAPKKNE
jgi:hypothetical protein